MKTSNKLFVAVVGLVLGSLLTYDVALRAEYHTGHYKDPLHNYDALAFRNFYEVAVPAASAVNVKIVAGPFAVHVQKELAEFIHITQQGQQLKVALTYPKEKEWEFRASPDAVVISCPHLATLTTDGVYTVAGKTTVGKAGQGCNVEVQGFKQDSLALRQDRASVVRLTGNTLGYLRAVAGTSLGSSSRLVLNQDNHIEAASLTVAHKSYLEVQTTIPQMRYDFSDDATVTFSGAAARKLGTVAAK